MNVNAAVVRKMAWHYVHPTAAEAAGMTVEQMKQFIAGTFTPSQEQLRSLARYMGVDR